jgi:hypothetical protein
MTEKKVRTALAKVRQEFPKRAPKEESHLRKYAQRYAASHGLPSERPAT